MEKEGEGNRRLFTKRWLRAGICENNPYFTCPLKPRCLTSLLGPWSDPGTGRQTRTHAYTLRVI